MKRLPLNTYRLQLTPDFGFDEARKVLPYLKRLGVTDLYFSPILKTRPGSTHGYDVTDPTCLNPELGDEAAFDALAEEVKKLGLGWVQDIVPNHMAFCRENIFLMDVLENGGDSEYAHLFDIYWDHPDESLRGRILAPFLGRFLGECLDDREIRVSYDVHGFSVNYYTLKFPLRIETYRMILERTADRLQNRGDAETERVRFSALAQLLTDLTENPKGKTKKAYVAHIKKSLHDLYEASPAVRESIDAALAELNAPDEAARNTLEELLQKQAFRLSFWKVSSQEISYRRFFNINELISVRVEDETVFEAIHALIFKLAGKVFTGLRIDHIDGLYDPKAYLERLSRRLPHLAIYVEKILAEHESLPQNWPVEGTTGYDFLNYLGGLYCDGANVGKITKFYMGFSGLKQGYGELEYLSKNMIVRKNMAGDVDNLARQLKMIATRDLYGSDITMEGLKSALVEIMAHLPVYRTYITEEGISEADRTCLERAISPALEQMPDLLYEIRFIARCLFEVGSFHASLQEELTAFIHRLQQFTGPVTAKGVEDTLMYRYNRLLSLNEVGGFPGKFGVTPEEFHAFIQRRRRDFPHDFNATSTHDTKRGEDLRARLNVLSELPHEWQRVFKSLHRRNIRRKRKNGRDEIPDRNDEYFLYQILVATLPPEWKSMDETAWLEYRERIAAYILKSIREAKHHTEWIKPDEVYESGYLAFLETLLNRDYADSFLETLDGFAGNIRYYGLLNTLSQTILKAGMPGVFDLYRGCEELNLSLVDPDNRRPVDFASLHAALETMPEADNGVSAWLKERFEAGEWDRIKHCLLYRALNFRAERPGLFAEGTYTPLYAEGPLKEHITAFILRHENATLLVACGRLFSGFTDMGSFPLCFGQEETRLKIPGEAGGAFADIFTGRSLPGDTILLSELFLHLPGVIAFREERNRSD